MRTKHVTKQIEPYLDQQLSPQEKQAFEEHLSRCPACTRRLFDAERLRTEIGSVMQSALGRPKLPATLRRRVRHRLRQEAGQERRPRVNWAVPGRIFNGIATAAIIILLAFAAFGAVQSQLPGVETTEVESVRPNEVATAEVVLQSEIPTPTPQPETRTIPLPTATSVGDTLEPTSTPLATVSSKESLAENPALPLVEREPPAENRLWKESIEAEQLSRESLRPGRFPDGTIAFSFFNPAEHRQTYEVHMIRPDGSDHRIFPLDGVSEPALRLMGHGYQIAYRAWSEPTAPRALLVSNLAGRQTDQLTLFWEDGQPDWSPTEYRVIFASQRESDRRWRLYTVWGDGTSEINLRREGKSPTFAPDGYRFAFESCDSSANRCGLWIGDLENSEYGSEPFLENPLARSPDWSPVSEEIAYMANPNGNWDLYLVNSSGRNNRRLTTSPAIEGLPTWSPDGEWLAFLSNRSGEWGIWIIHPASGVLHQVFTFDGGVFTPPERPPYGKRNWWDEQLSWGE